MSIRKTIMNIIHSNGVSTIDDIADAAQQLTRKQLLDNVKSAVEDGLLNRIKDVVTGHPAYEPTEKGNAWIKCGGGQIGRPPTTAVAKPVATAAAAPKAEPVLTQYDDRDEQIERLKEDLDRSQTNLRMAGQSIVDFCEWVGETTGEMPVNIYECREVILRALEEKPHAPDMPCNVYYVAELDSEIDRPITTLEESKHLAALHTLKTGRPAAIFALINRVESVKVEWAA